MKNTDSRIDAEIYDLLKIAAENSGANHTIWLDVNGITFIVMEHFTRGSRKRIKNRLYEMRRLGIVESRDFGSYTGWKMAADKCCRD